MIFWTVRYTNTQIQIHKYTNTACDEMPEKPTMCYIFEQLVVQGCKKWQSQVSQVFRSEIQTDFCTVPPGLFAL